MIERLEATLERYNYLENELTKPEVLSDMKKTKEYSKEMASLEEVVNCYKNYKKILEGIEETKEMTKDPELGEIAKEELKNIEEQKTKLDGELWKFEELLVEMKQTSLQETYLECIQDMQNKKDSLIKYITQ